MKELQFGEIDYEIQERLRCKNDIVYFVEEYCRLMTPEGIKHIKLHDYQKKILINI